MAPRVDPHTGRVVTPPRCKDCNTLDRVHPWRRRDQPNLEIFVWLCGSCKYKREHPDAAPTPPTPRAPKAPQAETLLDAIAEIEREQRGEAA